MRALRRRGAALGLALTLGAGCRGEPAPAEVPAPTSAGTAAPQGSAGAGDELGRARRARDGSLRYADEVVHDNPAAAAEILRRLEREHDAEVRAALVRALPATGGTWLEAVRQRLAREPDAGVRRAMVALAPRAPAGQGDELVLAGVDDGAASVRAEAALSAGSLAPLSAQLATRLVALLGDRDAPVRAAAARSLGIGAWGQAFEPVAALLSDPEPFVRLEAVRALGRLDRARAAGLEALRALVRDPDATVARAAARLLDAASR
ncbi:MAG: HEAT repeat domain-containing protein [Polyangiaceae bacterium]|nr:HEAT repeat domain-containing protein [Polyangiaceae bacterium]